MANDLLDSDRLHQMMALLRSYLGLGIVDGYSRNRDSRPRMEERDQRSG